VPHAEVRCEQPRPPGEQSGDNGRDAAALGPALGEERRMEGGEGDHEWLEEVA
jgi:hypothetical protein